MPQSDGVRDRASVPDASNAVQMQTSELKARTARLVDNATRQPRSFALCVCEHAAEKPLKPWLLPRRPPRRRPLDRRLLRATL